VAASSGEVLIGLASSTGIAVRIKPGKDAYPGVTMTPPTGDWDLSAFGHVEARVTNTGAKTLYLSLRVDNPGDWQNNPWDAESVLIEAGKTATLRTIFGYSYGFKPGFKLNPTHVPRVLLFAAKSDEAQSFRIESIAAAGPAGEKPEVAPNDVRIVPKDGILFGKGSIGEVEASNGRFTLHPKQGRWDLRAYDGVTVTVKNPGASPIKPRVRIETNGGASRWMEGDSIASGKEGSVRINFDGAEPVDLGKPAEGQIASDAVSAVVLQAGGSFESVVATGEPVNLPPWLGKRPPVPGDWSVTLNETFKGAKLNDAIWNDRGENYYDKVTHWTHENVILGDGPLKLRYSKKSGYQNDDPKRNKTGYAAGYLDTYGKWTQKYGYFEARMKLPNAPGLWPAFWLMPDRGASSGDLGARQDTGKGGMEFDIMEALMRWGGRRYNIAMHYDGYGKDHKALGSEKLYVQPDKDGFITCGLLWTPGSVRYYCNGKEILRWDNPRISNVASDIMFTLPSGGWDNDAVDDQRLPADFVIDYVRVWQRKDLLLKPAG